jgi:hypothetical protein
VAAASQGFVPRIFVSSSQEDSDFCLQFVQELRRAFGDENAVWYEADVELNRA